MKNVKFFSYLLIIISTSLFTSCTQENVDFYGTPKETITKSQWSVDYYFSGNDRTAQFNNYRLRFSGNGTVVANDGANSIDGNWAMVTDGNRNPVLQINMHETSLENLNNQWTIQTTSTDLLIMKGGEKEMRLRKL
jgi:hypothetical protein